MIGRWFDMPLRSNNVIVLLFPFTAPYFSIYQSGYQQLQFEGAG